MKKLSLLVVAALSATFILDSCSVQKRYHRTGFNVNWNHTSVRMKKDKHPSQSEEIVSEEVVLEEKVNIKEVQTPVSNYTYVNEEAVATVNDEVVDISASEVKKQDEVKINNSLTNAVSNKSNETISNSNSKIENSHRPVFKSKHKIFSKGASEPETWVYLLLILLVPFGSTISMYMYEGSWTSRVTVNLILTLLCGLPGVIHALIIIFGNK